MISFFFFNDTATTEIYTLSLHDALPISNTNTAAAMALVTWACLDLARSGKVTAVGAATGLVVGLVGITRSEEHTSELQSQSNLVCRLLLEKKKKHIKT